MTIHLHQLGAAGGLRCLANGVLGLTADTFLGHCQSSNAVALTAFAL